MINNFKTIKNSSKGFYKEKGSKFFAFAHPIQTMDDVNALNKRYRSDFNDARHVCYGYRLNDIQNSEYGNDDGEPSNAAGIPILNQIRSFELLNVIIFVVRYFGGTKLGVPGMIEAYKSAAFNALNNAEIINDELKTQYELSFEFNQMGVIMNIIDKTNSTIINQVFGGNVQLEVTLPISKEDLFLRSLPYNVAVAKP